MKIIYYFFAFVLTITLSNCSEDEDGNTPKPKGRKLSITISPPASGTVTITPDSSEYFGNTLVTIKATPNAGYEFVEWAGDISSTQSVLQFIVDENKFITVNFKEITPVASPSNLVAISVSKSIINLTWKDNAENEEKFIVERSLNGNTNWQVIAEKPANTTSHSDENLEMGATYFYRVKGVNSQTASNYSNIANATTKSVAVLRIINKAKYDLIDIRLNGQQFVDVGKGLQIGNYIDIEYENSGNVSYELAVGFWDGGVRSGWFTLKGNVYVSTGETKTIEFNNPTIEQLLTNFKSSSTFSGVYWENLLPYEASFLFDKNGNWTYYDNGKKVSSGKVSLVEWQNYAVIVSFKLCNDCERILFPFPFGSFYYKNGPPSWPTIEYVKQF